MGVPKHHLAAAAALLFLVLVPALVAARRAGQPFRPSSYIKSQFSDIRPCDIWG